MSLGEVFVNLFGNGFAVYFATQVVKGGARVLREFVPAFNIENRGMAIVALILALLVQGALSFGMFADVQTINAETLLAFGFRFAAAAQTFIGALGYYEVFKRTGVPVLGSSLTPQA